jgi:hypothetical protein
VAIKLIHKLEGVGAVSQADVVLLKDASYSIDVYRESLEGFTADGTYRIPGAIILKGKIAGVLPARVPLKLDTGNGTVEFVVDGSSDEMYIQGPILDKDGSSVY